MTDIIEIRDDYGIKPTYTPHETSIFSMSREQLEEYLLKIDKQKLLINTNLTQGTTH